MFVIAYRLSTCGEYLVGEVESVVFERWVKY